MILFALAIATWGDFISAGFLHGLKRAAVAVVAQAVWGMGSKLCTDRTRIALAIASACLALLWPGSLGPIAAIAATACFGLWRLKPLTAQGQEQHNQIGRTSGREQVGQ